MDPLQQSLEEMIQTKKKENRMNKAVLEDLSLEGIKCSTSSNFSNGSSHEDMNKSLSEIIEERQICTPQKGFRHRAAAASCYKNSVPEINLRPLDPLTTSLDDMIEKGNCNRGNRKSFSNGHVNNKRKMDAFDDSQGTVVMNYNPNLKWSGGKQRQHPHVTPYRAVGFLNKQGMLIEVKTGRLTEDHGDRSHLWRCIVTCGGIEGIADSLRKVVAREIACDQFLINLRQIHEDCHIPKYEILDELFIDPRIYHKLEREANQLGRLVGYETMIKPTKTSRDSGLKRQYTFVCNYLVGTDEFQGENVLLEYAKLIAARKAYIALTGAEVTPTEYFVGEKCDPKVKYDFSESEVFQTVFKSEDVRDDISEEPEEVKIEKPRRPRNNNYKKARKEEIERTRYMPVDIMPFKSSADNEKKVSTAAVAEHTKMEIDQPSDTNNNKPSAKKPKGRDRHSKFGIITSSSR